MPPLDLTGWMNGTVYSKDIKGKVVVVDFYATWCGPCMRAIPHNNEMLKKYQDKGRRLSVFVLQAAARRTCRLRLKAKESNIQPRVIRT